MNKHVLTIERWHPVRLNELLGCHWARRSRLKREDRNLVAVYARLQGIPPARGRRRVCLTVTMAPRQRCPDPDCFWKSLLDALVHAGLLVDDNPRWCELGNVTFRRGEDRATEIVLEDVETLSPRNGRAKHAKAKR